MHRRPLLDQWLAQLALFLGVDPNEIGQISGAKRRPTGRLDVATIQSLVRKGSVADLVARYGQVIVEECHHLPAVQFERVLREVKARYVVGLTATPQRRDGHQPITEMQLGPVRFEVNVLILNDVVRALEEGRSPILLTERKEHLAYFAKRLERIARHLVVLSKDGGGQRRTARCARISRPSRRTRSGSCSRPGDTSARAVGGGQGDREALPRHLQRDDARARPARCARRTPQPGGEDEGQRRPRDGGLLHARQPRLLERGQAARVPRNDCKHAGRTNCLLREGGWGVGVQLEDMRGVKAGRGRLSRAWGDAPLVRAALLVRASNQAYPTRCE